MRPSISEAAFQAQVIELAKLYRWRVYHTRDSRGSHAGFPDLVLVRGGDLVFLELKTEHGKATRQQEAWIGDLASVTIVLGGRQQGIFARIVRPSDFDFLVDRLR